VQPSQDNRRNILKNLEKRTTTPKVSSQHQSKRVHHKREDKNFSNEKIEYTRNAYLNTRRSHNNSGIGYNTGDKHNSMVNTKGQ
jgi:hypothetical protein